MNELLSRMLRLLTLFVAVVCLSPPAAGQPVSCTENAQCSEGYYCETDAHICRECLSCQDLKRESLALNTCIKSVAECGSCFKGLVVDRRGDVNAECVPPDASQLEPTPYYVWLLIGFGVLLFLALVVGIIAYLLRNPEIFKTAGSNQSSTVTARITATAPEAPPPYNPLPYTAVRTESPYTDVENSAYNEEDDQPFIKHRPTSLPSGVREAAGNQEANVFNKPIYEREPRPPSRESPVPEYEESMSSPIHDEDTVPSPWTPVDGNGNPDVNANGDSASVAGAAGSGAALPALLAAARDSTLLEPSAAKKRCVRQDSNNNRNRESSSCGDGSQSSFPRSPSPSQGGPPYSFITQITNVVQINTTK
ncbi:unnamed protein product [Chrysodeixis includens]|uniref:TNFR-Cys domain-containing protein n=1 Tax=Chrysodeixis includens TaxID=689277 RepID=A0A9P0C7W3_CHRIL|nr:unnamed protein product [Chrysodeixis includens]